MGAMSRIQIRRTHHLTHKEARARINRVAKKLAERFSADTRWDGDDLVVEHSGLTGKVSVRKTEIVVDAKLGLALGLFRSRAETEIETILDKELKA
jgi:putative polyhydroxyalkanoate system protein